ncbi:MAG: L,D-transpeptidase family protein [Actinomycetota bacterium]
MLRWPGAMVLTLAAVIAAVMATAGAYALAHTTSAHQRTAAAQRAGQQQAAGTGGAAAPLHVLAVSPKPGSHHGNGSQVTVTFSAPLAAGSPMPVLTPAVPGRWRADGPVAIFTPAALFRPGHPTTLAIPAGTDGVRSAAGGLLGRRVTDRFTVRAPAALRLGQLLAQLHYLPLSWSPAASGPGRPAAAPAGSPGGPSTVGSGPVGSSAAGSGTAGSGIAGPAATTAQVAAAYSPPAGSFRWHHGYPVSLHAQWRPGHPNLILRGAIMAFESQHGMPMDGVAGLAVWNAIFRATAHGQRNASGYTYAVASKAIPETLTIWHNGHVVMHTAVNTGIPVAPTSDGTYPVYLRYRFQIMRGLNPDGSSYADPVSYVAYFHGGEAVHYFPRGSYGFEQSLGCVELPLTQAAQAWPYLTYGSLVTVSG